MARRLQSVDQLLAPAVAETIAKLTLDDVDAGVRELALTYAREIDDAELVHATLTKVLREVAVLDVDLHDRLVAELVRVEQVHVVGLLGPKLLSALEQLGATPAARAKLRGGPSGATAGRLAILRQTRRA